MDLTIHSSFSPDSRANIDKILRTAQKSGLQCISITDKNTAICHMATNLPENKKIFSGKIIPGAEFEANYNNKKISFLCYGFDVMRMQQWANENYEKSEKRQIKTFALLKQICQNLGVIIDKNMLWNPKVEYAYQYFLRNIKLNPLNRKFFAKGRFPATNMEFHDMITKDKSSPFYIDRTLLLPTPDEIINTVHQNRGLVFLANPRCFENHADDALRMIKQKRIDGVEVYSPDFTKSEESFWENFCFKNGLMKTGGSHFDATKQHSKMINLKGKLFLG